VMKIFPNGLKTANGFREKLFRFNSPRIEEPADKTFHPCPAAAGFNPREN